MTIQYWIVKQEPDSYSWDSFVKDGQTGWEGVRNYQARNNLRSMRRGDVVLFYASGGKKAVLGTAFVVREAYPDPTAGKAEDWVAVTLRAGARLANPVTLARIKADRSLSEISLVRNSRLSVLPLTAAAYSRIVSLGGS